MKKRETCGACYGRGSRLVRDDGDWILGIDPSERRADCAACEGLGFRVLTLPDVVKCVCGLSVPSIAALAAHRAEAHPEPRR
jgi:hypothetical protein